MAILTLSKVKRSFGPSKSPSESNYLKVLKPSIRAGHTSARKTQKIKSQPPLEEGVLHDDPS